LPSLISPSDSRSGSTLAWLPAHPLARLSVAGLAVLLAALIGFRLWLPEPYLWAESFLLDRYQRATAKSAPETRVVIVDIDEGSLAKLGRWPWPRARLAALVHALFDDYGAAAVAIDMVLPEAADRDGDAAIERLARDKPLVLAQAFDFSVRTQPVKVGVPVSGLPALTIPDGFAWPQATGYVANHTGLAQARCAGHISFKPDADGVIRRIPPLIRWQERDYPMLPIALMRCASRASMPPRIDALGWRRFDLQAVPNLGLIVPVEPGGEYTIAYRYTGDAYSVIPALEIMEHAAPRELLGNVLVLIGSSSLGLTDFVSTPLAPLVPGVMVQAQIVSALLDSIGAEPATPPAGRALPWIWIAASIALLALLVTRGRVLATLGLLFLLVLGWLAMTVAYYPPSVAQPALVPLVAYAVLLAIGAPMEWYFAQEAGRRLYSAFKDYVAPAVLQELVAHARTDVLAIQRREVTVLFADIEDYTALGESLSPEIFAALTQEVLDVLTHRVHESGGTLDKYMGDALMALWGAPLPVADHADRALDAANGMHRALQELNRSLLARGLPQIRVHVGVNSGEAVVGDLGTRFRRAYTAIGNCVNLAARLQALAREQDRPVLVGEATARSSRRHRLVSAGSFALRGRLREEVIYELQDPGVQPPSASGAQS
jgi:adenylate cyclase